MKKTKAISDGRTMADVSETVRALIDKSHEPDPNAPSVGKRIGCGVMLALQVVPIATDLGHSISKAFDLDRHHDRYEGVKPKK